MHIPLVVLKEKFLRGKPIVGVDVQSWHDDRTYEKSVQNKLHLY